MHQSWVIAREFAARAVTRSPNRLRSRQSRRICVAKTTVLGGLSLRLCWKVQVLRIQLWTSTNPQPKRHMTSASRENNFDVLRLVLAVLVIYSHSFPLATGIQDNEPFYVITRRQMTFGGFSVNCFFIVSGYLIAQSWERTSSLWKYMRKRFARIHPGFIVATAVSSWIVVICAGTPARATFNRHYLLDFLKTVPLLRDPTWPQVFVNNPMPLAVNGSTWTIHYEFFCYIVLAAMGLVGMFARRRLVLLTYVVSIVALGEFEACNLHFGADKLTAVGLNLVRFIPLFLAGVVYYSYRESLPCNGKWALAALLGLVVSARSFHGLNFVFPILGAYLLFYLAFSRYIRLYRFAKYGDFSYGTYLYAFPIQQLVVHWHGGRIAPTQLFVWSAPLALLVGAASWYLVERPFLRPRKKGDHRGAVVNWAAPDGPGLESPKAES